MLESDTYRLGLVKAIKILVLWLVFWLFGCLYLGGA